MYSISSEMYKQTKYIYKQPYTFLSIDPNSKFPILSTELECFIHPNANTVMGVLLNEFQKDLLILSILLVFFKVFVNTFYISI